MADRIAANIDAMLGAAERGTGMDIVIVSTTSAAQAAYWQRRLEATRSQVCGREAIILAVHEDWDGGAGNGLGTLYAIEKGARLAAYLHGIDIMQSLAAGAAAAVYHTAGKGTRLAPLPGSESSNKPAVRLPALLSVAGETKPLTILEAVIQQTSIFAESRRGRVSVFWGDQIFVPTGEVRYQPRHHADILCKLRPMPKAKQWLADGLDRYGLIAVGADGEASQVEKISHATAKSLIAAGRISAAGGIGVSLGSFSMSAALTQGLLQLFASELSQRRGQFDSDPHFWMPLTLDGETYQQIMHDKACPDAATVAHYRRLQEFRAELLNAQPELGVFGAVDVGRDALWWDYGQLQRYAANLLKLTDYDAEAVAMRRFFRIHEPKARSDLGAAEVDAQSIVLDSHIERGRVQNSVLIGVDAAEVDAVDSVIVSAASPCLRVVGGLVYNVADTEAVELSARAVRADVFLPPDCQQSYATELGRDGKDDWHIRLPGNPRSYDEMTHGSRDVDPAAAEEMAAVRRRQIAASLAASQLPRD